VSTKFLLIVFTQKKEGMLNPQAQHRNKNIAIFFPVVFENIEVKIKTNGNTKNIKAINIVEA
jgi:hypothetical protein